MRLREEKTEEVKYIAFQQDGRRSTTGRLSFIKTIKMSDMDGIAYVDSQRKNSEEYEALCKQCGKRCGLETDPCANLKKGMSGRLACLTSVPEQSGRYYCAVYDSRLGRQVTVSGRVFTCVEIREVIRVGLPNEGCGYGR